MLGLTLLLQLALDKPAADLLGAGFGLDEAAIGLGVGLGLLVVLLSRGASARWRWARHLDEDFRLKLSGVDQTQIFKLAFMSAAAEEIFFRGFLQGHLGLTLTAALFGLAHLPSRWVQAPWTIAAIVIGFALGWLFEIFGSILPAFLAHFIVNFFNLHSLISTRSGDASRCRMEPS